MRIAWPHLTIAMVLAIAVSGAASTAAAQQSSKIPAWLQKHVGLADGQIAPVVLQRARALYERKKRQGKVRNPCYLAMDATRPSTTGSGKPGRRFYVICEKRKSFRAVSSGYGNGRKLKRANFSNDRQCARNFSNAEGSKLTAGGSYVTAETRTSFKGYYRQSGKRKPFHRTFLLFDGEGETANARQRAIGGHPAVFLKWQCRFKNPKSAHADKDGYVPLGKLVNYTGGGAAMGAPLGLRQLHGTFCPWSRESRQHCTSIPKDATSMRLQTRSVAGSLFPRPDCTGTPAV